MKHKLTPTDKKVWQVLTNMDGLPISIIDIADKANTSRTTVSSSIRKLLNLGVVDRKESVARGLGVPNSYAILQSPGSYSAKQKEAARWWWIFGDEVCLRPEYLFEIYKKQSPESALHPEESYRLWLILARMGLIKTESGKCVVRRVGNDGASLHVLVLTDAGCKMIAKGFAEYLIEKNVRAQVRRSRAGSN